MSERSKKYNPRRLFSFDSLKSSRAASSSDSANNYHAHERRSTTLSQADELLRGDPFGDGSRAPASEIQLNDVDKKPLHSRTSTTVSAAPASEQPSRSSTPESTSSTTSSSRARWDKLRQHVLLPSPSPTRQPTPQPTNATSALSPQPRSVTPKPSRLARLGFRQVVEQAKEVAEDTLVFANEIRRTCWLARYGEQFRSKNERDTLTATMPSTLYLPFMSNPAVSGPSVAPVPAPKRQETMGSQATLPSPPYSPGQRSVPTLKPLWQLLMTYATPTANGVPQCSSLPHETLVLSVLQAPFLKPAQQGWMQEERRLAMESFELIYKAWFPDNESSFANYCLWCCGAALIAPGHLRLRALNGIHGLIGPRDVKLIRTPAGFETLVSGLLNLLALSSVNPTYFSDTDGMKTIKSCLELLRSGACVAFDPQAFVERYGLAYSKGNESMIYTLLTFEALARCIECFKGPTRAWLIQYACDDGWVPLRREWIPSPLLTKLHIKKLNSLSRAMAYVLSPCEAEFGLSDSDVLLSLQLLQTRILPEVEIAETKEEAGIKQHLAKVALHILILDCRGVPNQWATSVIHDWFNGASNWWSGFESALGDLVSNEVWSIVLRALKTILQLIRDPVCQGILAFVVPLLNQRIAQDAPPYPCPDLSSILNQVSQRYPPIFYKSLFSCVASSKDYAIINHLCILMPISKFVPDYWIRDPEMISIALISDVSKKSAAHPAGDSMFKSAQLGQLVILIELIGQIQAVRHRKEEIQQTESAFLEVLKFASHLESRLAILLDAREREALYPVSHRMVFCILFRELRLLTRSSKPAPWLTKIVTWFVNFHDDAWMNDADYNELEDTLSRLQALYEAARYGATSSCSRRRSTTLLIVPNPTPPPSGESYVSDTLAQSLHVLKSAQKGFAAKTMKLLVLMSTLMTREDYIRLGPIIWMHSLDGTVPSALNSACFLAMQCAEKTPQDFVATIEVDLKSSDDLTRIYALRRFSTLYARRFELAPQQTIMDRYHRPFKLARGPLPFIPTDMGSSSYVFEDDFEAGQNSLPLELKKQLTEIGWTQEDSLVASRQAGLRTPMLLLPAQDFARLEMTALGDQMFSSSPLLGSERPLSSGEGTLEQQLLRRNSSSGGPSYAGKRRSVFAPSLAFAFVRIAVLVFDPNVAVSSAARNLILDLMRNDPSLLSRPLLDLLSNDEKDIPLAMSRLDLLMHAHWAIPPSMAHYVFNHLAGHLKAIARENNGHDLVQDFAGTIPPLADLVSHVSGISVRELRRSKIETFLVPTGSFWFPRFSPNEHMFPTELSRLWNSSESVPSSLISVTLIRVCQNLLFSAILRKNQQDVQFIRKNMSRFELPSMNGSQRLSDLELGDFLPSEGYERKLADSNTLSALSMMLSRSYLLLFAQIFRSMSRHLSDRDELAVFIDGLNRIMLAHGDDIGIVSQTLVTLMIASTRFRRLFMSGGAYMLFMPAVLKIYADAESHSGVKSAIEYVVGRFYALHKDAFIFQSLDMISRLTALPGLAGDKLGKNLVDLFASLRETSSSVPDVAGIHDANKGQEREALLLDTVEERPQALLASMKQGISEDGDRFVFDVPEEYQAPKFRVSDFAKLFFTIIAHDIHSLRAGHFLKLFCLVVPYVYRTSLASRPVLQEGIDALGTILMKPSAKMKPSHPGAESLLPTENWSEKRSSGSSRPASNVTTMRLDYLTLVVSFVRSGGTVAQSTIRRITDIIRGVLKDSGKPDAQISGLLSDLTEIMLSREDPSGIKDIVAYLQDLAPVISTYGVTLDFSRIFAALARLTTIPMYVNDNNFTLALVQVCEAGLATCALAGMDKLIMALPHRSSLVSLLSHAAMLRGVDIASELEKHPPTHDYLAGIILPLVTTVGTEAAVLPADSDLGSGQHSRIIHLWIRLLQYTLTACQSNQPSASPENSRRSMDRSRSIDSTRTSSPTQVPTFAIAIQVLKAILVRAGPDLSSHLPAFWHRLAVILKKTLEAGNAEFALQLQEPPHPSSPMMSPAVTPRTSLQLDPSILGPTKSYFQSPKILQRSYQNPRMVDYVMWSLFELLCSYRTPLLLQMRFFIAEKMVDLDQGLRAQNLHGTSSPILSLLGFRPTSISAFSKPFRRTSGLPSPSISPRLHQGQNSPYTSGFLTVSDGRKPGYQYQSPVVSTEGQDPRPGPRIVHLGPISTSLLRPAILTSGTSDISLITRAAKVKSLSLTRATYRRIRLVQTYMGYHSILPLPYHEGTDVDTDEVTLSSWTKYYALEAIKNEVNELLEEFEETQDVHDETVIIEPTDYSLDTDASM